MRIIDLETPALLLDRAVLDRNIARMRRHLDALGVPLRPHVKTAKSIDVVRRVTGAPAMGITVSTLREAEYFFGRGTKDILYAVGIAPSKLQHVADLRRRGADVTVILDSGEMAECLAAKGAEWGVSFPALVEIDSDGHRSGVEADGPQLIDIAARLHQHAGTNMRGVLTHAGGSYACQSTREIVTMAEQERVAVTTAAARLERSKLPCPIVSVGSTPTALFAERLDGVSEVRAGVYMFCDLVMMDLGVCARQDIALSVLTTVIGHQPARGQLITDAGWMGLSADRGLAREEVQRGFGVVCDLAGNPQDDLVVVSTNQEHGIVASASGTRLDVGRFPIGTMLRILPNHACATAAQYDAYHVVASGPDVEAVWSRMAH